MARRLCVVQDFLTEEHRAAILDAAAPGGFTVDFYRNFAEAKGRLSGTEVLYCDRAENAREATENNEAGALRWVASSWAGIAPFLQEGVLPAGCLLTKGAGTFGVVISEYVIAMTINLLKRFPEYAEPIRRREWPGGLHIRSIYGSAVTIVGTGDIGQNVASRMRGLSAGTITGVNYTGRNPEDLFDRVLPFTRIDEVLPKTDILVLCAPDTPETTGMISRGRLAMLPEHAVIVNVGRGTILDQKALADRLNDGKLLGAALDVMVPEPLPADDPLWDARNIILTPHISGFMTLDHTADQSVRLFTENLRRYLAGEPLEHQVDFGRGY